MLKTIVRRFAWFIQLYRRQYLIAAIFVLINYGLALLPPRLIGSIADALAANRLSVSAFVGQLGALLLLFTLIYLVNYTWNVRLLSAQDLIGKVTRERLVERYLRRGPTFYSRHTAGELLTLATQDISVLSQVAGYGVITFFDGFFNPIMIVGMMVALTSWEIALAAILPYPILLFISFRIGKKLYPCYVSAQEELDDLTGDVLEEAEGVRVIRAFGRQGERIERFDESTERLRQKQMRTAFYSIVGPAIAKVMPALSYLIGLSVAAYALNIGALTPGRMVAFAIYLDMLVFPMSAVGEFINIGQMASASMARIQDLLAETEAGTKNIDRALMMLPEAKEPEEKGTVQPIDQDLLKNSLLSYRGEGPLVLKQHSFTFPGASGQQLQAVDLCIEAGQTIGITGRIGSGKSALLSQLAGLYEPPTPPAQDSIWLNGLPLRAYDQASVRACVGYCRQESFLFSRTIRENILFGAGHLPAVEADRRLCRVLEIADLGKDLKRLPDGLETIAGERGVSLSGGQQQRICLARTLMSDPPILLLDDSLSAVDTQTEAAILRELQADRQGKTTLIAAHRLSCLREADLILIMERGRIVARGTHCELLQQSTWYREQFIHQQEKNE